MKAGSKNKRNVRMNSIISLFTGLAVIILLNILGNYYFTRFDLTSEKRYTLSESTRNLLGDIDDIVYFKVYLYGEFPAGFKRLSRSTREMLDEFRAYNKNIEYDFIDPSANADQTTRNSLYRQLVEKGLEPTNLQVREKEGTSQQIIFPGALISYKTREIPLQLLKSQLGIPPEAVLNNSIQGLEYNIASALQKLMVREKPSVAFIEGHGELQPIYVLDAANALSEYYKVERVSIDGRINSLTERDYSDSSVIRFKNRFNAIIIAQPTKALPDKDLFIIDQYIMRGGKVLWLIDPVIASMDSLQASSEMVGVNRNLNLDKMFFKYGFRLNYDLIMDINALPIPVKTGQIGNQPQFDYFPWYYFPLSVPLSTHPVVNNLNAVKFEFVSSIDTVVSAGTRKTVLLRTSKYSRLIGTPAYITLEILRDKPDESLFKGPPEDVALLVEGNFESFYRNRIPHEIAQSKEIGFQERSKPTKMIIVSDGDVIKNQLRIGQGTPLPLGYDQYTGESFGNRDFILNAVNYLCDESGLISIRSRELKLRLLDRARLNDERTVWQLVNTVVPVVLVLIFGILFYFTRKRKYAR